MSRFKEKLEVLRGAQVKVRQLRGQVNAEKKDFQCKESMEKQTVIVTDDFYGAHVKEQDYAMPMRCIKFDRYQICADCECARINWNKRFVGLSIQMRDARRERNKAVLDLFYLKEKVADIKEYRQVKKLKKEQSKNLWRLYCAYCFIAQDAWDIAKAKQVYENALADYIDTEEKFIAARRKLWKRNK